MEPSFRNTILVFFGVAIAGVIAALALIEPGPPKGAGPMIDAERAVELAKAGKRLQIVTFMDGMIPLPPPPTEAEPEPETTEYAIISGQITLGQAESADISYGPSGFRGFKQKARILPARGDGFYDSSATVSGAFNNVLIYDKKTGAAKKIFDTRITITAFKLFNNLSKRVIVFTTASDDTNKDGKLDGDDRQKLFVYTMADGELHPVEGMIASPTRFIDVDGVDYLVSEGVQDTNNDGIVTDREGYEPEPRMLYRIDLETFAAKPLLDTTLINDVQATLDGAKQATATRP